MNLKKLSYLPIGFLILFDGCASLTPRKVDQLFVEDVWAEVKRVTNLDSASPLPEINYLEHCYEFVRIECYRQSLCDPEAEKQRMEALKRTDKQAWKRCRKKEKTDALGVYYFHCRNIDICLTNLNRSRWWWGYAGIHLNEKEREAAFYNTVAHELLHHALFLTGIVLRHHKIMKEEKYLEKVIDMISRHFDLPLDGLQKEISMQSLDQSIRSDEENNEEREERLVPLLIECGGQSKRLNYHNYQLLYLECK